MPTSHRILAGCVVVVALTVPLYWLCGWPAVFGYVVGFVAMTAYLLYLLLFA